MNEKAIEVMRKYSLINAAILYQGLKFDAVEVSEIQDYAASNMEKHIIYQKLFELVIEEKPRKEELVEVLFQLAQIESGGREWKEWAFKCWEAAGLETILNNESSGEEKLDQFEDLYSFLGYPENLRACSRYYAPSKHSDRAISPGSKLDSPISAMRCVLEALLREVGVINH